MSREKKTSESREPAESVSCLSCRQRVMSGWVQVVLSDVVDDIYEGKVKAGEVHRLARWLAPMLRDIDIERVALALERAGWARYLGNGLIQILDIDEGDMPADPQTEVEGEVFDEPPLTHCLSGSISYEEVQAELQPTTERKTYAF